MSLTLDVEQRLDAAGLIKFYEKDQNRWWTLAFQSYDFAVATYPKGSQIRSDDVAKALIPALTVDEELGNYLSANKLRQKYWFKYFADLVIDRDWPRLATRHGKKK